LESPCEQAEGRTKIEPGIMRWGYAFGKSGGG
jgi:hypothetical protein